MIDMIIMIMVTTTMTMTMTMMMMIIIIRRRRPGERIEKTVEGQNKGCAYGYWGSGDNPKRISRPS